MQVVQVGRRVERSKIAVGQKRVRGGDLQPARQHGLEGVARGDVLLDAPNVILESLVGIGRDRRRKARHVVELERRRRTRLGQAREPAFDSVRRCVEESSQLGLARVVRHFHVRDDRGAVVEIVEDEERVGDHEHGVGQAAIVGRGVGKMLDRSHDVVAEIPHGPAGKARQAGHRDRGMPPQRAADVLQRGDVAVDHVPTRGRRPPRALAVSVSEHFSRVGGQKRVSGPPLAALQRLQKKSVRPPVELGEGGHRRVAVEHHLPRHGHHPARGASALGEGREAGGHCGAATR